MSEEKEIASETNGQNSGKENNVEDETNLETSIIKQVEYYFSDVNIPRDKFLSQQITLDDGWVPLDVLIKFKRLAKLTTDVKIIANALSKSTSGLLEISDDNKKVRRSPDLPVPEMNEDTRKEIRARTIYAKGFSKCCTLDELLEFFGQFEKVENIIMRRYQDRQTKMKHFKGSVFVTFKTLEQAEKFLANKGLKYNDNELLILSQEKYLEMKQEEFVAKKEKKNKKNKEKEEKEDKGDIQLPTGTVIHFGPGSPKITRELIKEGLVALGAEIAFITYNVGDAEGWVRLAKENSAKGIVEKLPNGIMTIEDVTITFKVLEGDEEKAYLDKTKEEMVKRRKNQKIFRQNKGKNFKGKKNRKRKQEDQGDAPPAKVKAAS